MYKITLTAFLAATLLPVSASAVETSFHGFLTIGAGAVSESGIVYAGYDDDVSFEPDTVSGIQLGAPPSLAPPTSRISDARVYWWLARRRRLWLRTALWWWLSATTAATMSDTVRSRFWNRCTALSATSSIRVS